MYIVKNIMTKTPPTSLIQEHYYVNFWGFLARSLIHDSNVHEQNLNISLLQKKVWWDKFMA